MLSTEALGCRERWPGRLASSPRALSFSVAFMVAKSSDLEDRTPSRPGGPKQFQEPQA